MLAGPICSFLKALTTPNLHSVATESAKISIFANEEIVVMCYMKQLTVLKTNWSMKIARQRRWRATKTVLTEKLQSLKK